MKYVITIGNFDGIHIGHKKIISNAINLAKKLNVNSQLITFKTHTRALGNLILDNYDKINIIKNLGIDKVFELSFNDIKAMTPQEFIDKFLNDASGIIVGEDFRFGINRSGNVQDLVEYGKSKNIIVDIVTDIVCEGEKISSTKIRKLIEEGNMLNSRELLGYDFFVKSIVETGYKRGATLGFKTANISWPENIIKPKDGVYYTQIQIDDIIYDAMTMAGVAKTFNKEFSCETYIFDFDKNIYGKNIRLIFKEFLRENKKFESKEALISQLKRDKIKSIELAVKHKNYFTK